MTLTCFTPSEKGETYPITNSIFLNYRQPNAEHVLNSVSFKGDLIQLMDGSYWDVCRSNSNTMSNWRPGDIILIAPNPYIFSFSTYSIQNISAGTYVLANLSIQPFVDTPEAHWISAINYANRQVVLENGTVWEIDNSWDANQLYKWVVGDFVMIGSNDNYYSPYENILINTSLNLNKYFKARMY